MKIAVATMALLLCGAGFVSAQDDRERKMDELRREMERSMKSLQQKFDAERERLEREFKAARERFTEKKDERKDEKPRDLEGLVRELLKRVDSLEKKLDHPLPKLSELPRMMPRDFDFKRFQGGMPDEWRKWMEQMPRFKGSEDFRFEFRKGEPKKDKDEEHQDKPGKKKDEERKDKPKKKEHEDSF